MVQNGPDGRKWSKWSKMVKNGGPDLKRAQRTGLSARRARRTKLRGQKGLHLEVGARRAPRLLVISILLLFSRLSVPTLLDVLVLWAALCLIERICSMSVGQLSFFEVILTTTFKTLHWSGNCTDVHLLSLHVSYISNTWQYLNTDGTPGCHHTMTLMFHHIR